MLKIILCTLLLSLASSSNYHKLNYPTTPEAKCLDGTSPALYIHEGSQTNKMLIYFFGGGFCQGNSLSQSLTQCYERSLTTMGSSKYLENSYEGEGYLSTHPEVNVYGNWTKILIPYCDGAFHQGYKRQPVNYRGVNLYFRGQKNIESHIQYINNKYNLSKMQSLILAGTGEGAVAASLYSNHFQSLLPQSSHFSLILDSGFYLEATSFKTKQNNYLTQLNSLYKLVNVDSYPPNQVCNNVYGDESFRCFMLSNTYSHIFGHKLYIHSQYDPWAIRNILEIDCLRESASANYLLSDCSVPQREWIEAYRHDLLLKMIAMSQDESNSFWTISCSADNFNQFFNSAIERIPKEIGLTVKDAMDSFVGGSRVLSVDDEDWPGNQPCSQ